MNLNPAATGGAPTRKANHPATITGYLKARPRGALCSRCGEVRHSGRVPVNPGQSCAAEGCHDDTLLAVKRPAELPDDRECPPPVLLRLAGPSGRGRGAG